MSFYKHPINKKICKRYTSGIIVITLKNNKKIYVRDIKDLENLENFRSKERIITVIKK